MNSSILLNAVKEVLIQGESLLLALDDVAYATKVPAAFDASMGGHFRHCLDHFSCLCDGLDQGVVDYDARVRDPRIETMREVALTRTRELRRRVEEIPEKLLAVNIQVRSKVSYSAVSPIAESTVGRELMFCVVHAIHHFALIGVICRLLEISLPEGFGIAPSTLKHAEGADRIAA